INGRLADREGALREGMSSDRLHLSVKGYQVWADALKPILAEVLGPPAKEDLAPPPTGDPSASGRSAASAALGQPPAGAGRSPEVRPDRGVTLRVRAPKAAEVTLTGDWLPPGRTEKLTRDAAGVWSVTVGPLGPGIAIYNFNIDGLAVADPVNPRVKLRARTS